MSPSQWGPPTWRLFHCLAENIKEDRYPFLAQQLYSYIYQICSNLPCPDCSQHAKMFLAKVNAPRMTDKSHLRSMLFIFHNTVNKRKNKPQYEFDNLTIYQNINFIDAFNEFSKYYITKGNMNQINDNIYRGRILQNMRNWLLSNLHSFNYPSPMK